MSIRVFLVDDEPAVCRGLAVLLEREPGLEVCGQAGSVHEALVQMLQLRPDLAIIDLSLKEASGMELIHNLRAFDPKPKILVFSMHAQPRYVRAAMRAGADGYVTKEDGAECLVEAIQCVLGGNPFLTQAVAASLAASPSAHRDRPTDPPRHD